MGSGYHFVGVFCQASTSLSGKRNEVEDWGRYVRRWELTVERDVWTG